MQVATSVAHHKRPVGIWLRGSGQRQQEIREKVSKRFPNFFFCFRFSDIYIHILYMKEGVCRVKHIPE